MVPGKCREAGSSQPWQAGTAVPWGHQWALCHCEGLGRKLRGKSPWKARCRQTAAGAPGEESDSAGGWQMEHGVSASSAGETRGRLCFPRQGQEGPCRQGFKNCSPELRHCQRANQGGAELCQCLPARHQGVPSSKGKGQGSVCQQMWEEINAM